MKILVTLLFLVCTTGAFAQWERCENGMDGGPVVCMISNGDRIIAGTMRGIYFSTDKGDSWRYSPGDDHGALRITQVYEIILFKSKLFAATDNGVYYSTDNGDNWLITSLGYDRITAIVANSECIIAASIFGDIKRSFDEGQTWELIGEGLPVSYLHSLAVDDAYIYVGGENGMNKSSDNGSTWTSVPIANADLKKVEFLKVVKGKLYIGLTKPNLLAHLLYVSTDRGQNWIQTDIELGYGSCYDVEADDNNYYVATKSGAYRSTRADSLWTCISKSFTRNFTLSLCLVGEDLFAGTNDGVYYSSNKGDNWIRKSLGLRNIEVYKVYANGANSLVGTRFSGIYYSSDYGNNWQVTDTKLNFVRALEGFGNEAYASGDLPNGDFQIMRWDIDSKSWQVKNEGASKKWVFCFVVDSEEVYGAGPYGAVRSTNKGENWEGTNLPNTISCMAIKDGKIIAGSSEKSILYWSHNKGMTWSEQAVDQQIYNSIHDLLIKDGIFFVGTNDGLFVSSDDGSNWSKSTKGLLNDNVLSLASSGEHLFAGTEAGLYYSSDCGLNWKNVTRNLPFGYIGGVWIGGEYVFASDPSIGLYRSKIEDLLHVSVSESIDKKLTTLNPSPATDYVFLPEGASSTNEASVYSLLGVKLFTCLPESGRINVSLLSPGVYLLEHQGLRYRFVKE